MDHLVAGSKESRIAEQVMRLPGAPGTELIKLAEGTPVLIMTSYASLRSAVDSMKMGAVDYIAKPFSLRELLARVRVALRRGTPVAADPAPGGGARRIAFLAEMLEIETHFCS